eukprot:2114839-Pyramimonas_sp.AAC.1
MASSRPRPGPSPEKAAPLERRLEPTLPHLGPRKRRRGAEQRGADLPRGCGWREGGECLLSIAEAGQCRQRR